MHPRVPAVVVVASFEDNPLFPKPAAHMGEESLPLLDFLAALDE